jgi:hypothetical protein
MEKLFEKWRAFGNVFSMKLRISIIGLFSILVLFNGACSHTTRNSLAYEKSRFVNPNRSAVIAARQTDPNLPPVAAGPGAGGVGDISWGGSLSTR